MEKNTNQLAFQDVEYMIVYRKEEEMEEQILEEQDVEEDYELTDENVPDIDDFDPSESSNEKREESTDSLGLSDGACASKLMDK
ncbi:uncharacterized protein MONOS_15115 [Monocercomonoides exilis]|uniref:uncharacterized protein n=1 Tax=Monocercomonoides exilis TaxID=2049356 RepID=UPI003559D3CD|nr:hypothetical protein MONOS_15115 [Monocercomonoides exilis]|eukprot:MONOS_15115.1-p1 / transcript=MONOS_15115.1 / gene=MONOS_15115 / organism=Monocercomonoides_exilis_PA203 / gene_product=unspecified product / transcript_product=unspecified product / location=Mono_scaffold01148:2253-2504(-) / protein_length=84 / sequence_SO=supercontig / SO=protein_coding / is_pseudo=false